MTRVAAFLDRDGTLIVDEHYLADATRVQLLPGAAESVAAVNASGLLAVVATNQSGIARGLITPAQYEAVRHRLDDLLEASGARLDASYLCPHGPPVS
ncbi:MAG: HAD-IIIA family hydrolase, partial [Gemmatimonadaceae bacterium]